MRRELDLRDGATTAETVETPETAMAANGTSTRYRRRTAR